MTTTDTTDAGAAAPPVAFSLGDGLAEWPEIAIAGGVALVAGWVVARLVHRLATWILNSTLGTADPGIARRLVGRPLLVARLLAGGLTCIAVVLPLLDALGVAIGGVADGAAMRVWLLGPGLRIALVISLVWLVIRIVSVATRRLEAELGQGTGLDVLERAKRAQTLGRLVQNVLTVLFASIALLMVLRELGVDILPMLTGAGIAGVALGFGAQWLVRDIIAGFFLIFENHIRVGDVAIINGTGGVVEAINLRTIVLRDLEGTVHVFPNGAITTLANKTKDFAYAVIDVSVAYRQDTDRVTEILHAVGAELRQDPAFKDAILDPIEVLGVDAFFDNKVTVKARIKTVPLKQWDVARALRRRIRIALEANQVALPPQTVPIAVVPARDEAAES